MNQERKLRAVRKVLGDPKIVKGDEHVFYCPSSDHDGKKKLKLSVNLVTDEFNCWSCHFRGKTLAGILALIPFNPDLDEYLDAPIRVEPGQQEEYEPVELPKEFVPLTTAPVDYTTRPYFKYLSGRKIGVQEIRQNRIGFCQHGHFAGRIVIPSFDANGNLNTFAARTIHKDVTPRYDTPHVDKTGIIFNELSVDWTRNIILVEGPFDAIIAGDNAVAMCGKVLSTSTSLFKKLVLSKVTVYVALDPDAWEEGIDICIDLAAHGVNSRYVTLRGGDPANMGRAKFRERLLTAVDVNDRLQAIVARVARMK